MLKTWGFWFVIGWGFLIWGWASWAILGTGGIAGVLFFPISIGCFVISGIIAIKEGRDK